MWTWLTYYLSLARIVQAPFDVEWSENWKSWPHCNGQARCWMHTSAQWCDCVCWWCRIARRFR